MYYIKFKPTILVIFCNKDLIKICYYSRHDISATTMIWTFVKWINLVRCTFVLLLISEFNLRHDLLNICKTQQNQIIEFI